MSPDNLIPLIIFAGVAVCTPGPANMLVLISGTRNGVARSLPLLAGVVFGFFILHISFPLGLWKLIAAFPFVLVAMKIAGAAYILWLAWQILQTKIGGGEECLTQTGFVSGLFIAPLNPKAWAVTASAYGQFIDGGEEWWTQVAIIITVFFCWHCVSQILWCWCGARVMRFLSGTRTEKWLMRILAALMVGAVLWALLK